jgi:hypothetical protein
LAFAIFLTGLSLFLLYSAFGISGFEALSAPGAIPMATTLAMTITAGIVLVQTLRLEAAPKGAFLRRVLPPVVVVMMGMLLGYAVLLKPLGFLPTSALFLIAAIHLLARRGWVFSVATGLFSLLIIYLTFRIGFTVLMPVGIVPEGELLAWVRALIGGGR